MKTFFGFAFGGNNDFGKVMETSDSHGNAIKVDFPKEAEIGYGLAIRNADCDNTLAGATKLVANVSCDNVVNVVVEFKTQCSGGAPETSVSLEVKAGEVELQIEVPELKSSLTEIVIFIPKNENKELVTSFALHDYKICH